VQALLSLQTIAVWMQAPVAALQVSVVQALLSLQRVVASAQGLGHCPVAGSQLPVVQTTGVNTHPVAGLQVSVVQRLLSLHVIAA
jgi:hypothetical protein